MFAFDKYDNPFGTRRWMRIIRTQAALFASRLSAVLSLVAPADQMYLVAKRYG
jgi:hypothetical protein